MTREAVKSDRRWEALWNYREAPPTVGEGKNRTVIPFENWLAQLGLGEEVKDKGRTLTDEDIKKAFSRGVKKVAVLPPGMKIKEK